MIACAFRAISASFAAGIGVGADGLRENAAMAHDLKISACLMIDILT
jgi:hypothetical protein